MRYFLIIILAITLFSCNNAASLDGNAIVETGNSDEFNNSETIYRNNYLLFSEDNSGLKHGNGTDKYIDLPYIQNPNVESGTYNASPYALRYGTNMQMRNCTYMKIDSVVHVSGYFTVDFNSYQDRVDFRINTPTGSTGNNISGTITGINMSQNSVAVGWIDGNSENEPTFNIKAGNSGTSTCAFTMTYTID